jgi:hypothetical protein
MLATATIDVHPPRAGPWNRRLPQSWRLRRLYYGLKAIVQSAAERAPSGLLDIRFDWATASRMLVPGWPQWSRGYVTRGRLFIGGYCLLLFFGLLMCGWAVGSLFLGLAFSVHLASIVDSLVGRFAQFRDRLAFTALCAIMLALFLYVPVGWAISRVATPIQITQRQPPFEAGDVLWYNRWSSPTPGDLVLYEFLPARRGGRSRGLVAVYELGGQHIDRLVALAGQTISWQDGELLVDGEPSPWQSRFKNGLDNGESFRVPESYVMILPDNAVPAGLEFTPADWRPLALVPQHRVSGRPFFRSLPLRRLSIIR